MSKIKKPDYDGFRAEIEALYPAYKGRIAVNQMATHNDAAPVLRDIATQIDPEVVTKIPRENLYRMLNRMLLGTGDFSHRTGIKFANCTYHFFDKSDAEIIASIGTPAQDEVQCQFSFICVDERNMNPRQVFHSLSSNEISAPRMKFNLAAMNPDAVKWFVFFHELCHAVTALDAHGPSKPGYKLIMENPLIAHYKKQMDETVCDAFAASHILRLYGDSALPMLRTWADMRLSRFPARGHEYFTGPAVSDIIRQYEEGSLQPRLANPESIFANARETAHRNYVTEGQFEKAHAILMVTGAMARTSSFRRFSENYVKKLFETHYGAKGKDPESLTEQEVRLRAQYNEAVAVIDRDYKDSAWGSFCGRLQRALLTPLHAAGLAPHPGY